MNINSYIFHKKRPNKNINIEPLKDVLRAKIIPTSGRKTPYNFGCLNLCLYKKPRNTKELNKDLQGIVKKTSRRFRPLGVGSNLKVNL